MNRKQDEVLGEHVDVFGPLFEFLEPAGLHIRPKEGVAVVHSHLLVTTRQDPQVSMDSLKQNPIRPSLRPSGELLYGGSSFDFFVL